MKLLRWNGERWYVDEQSVIRRLRRWVLWPGGWETFRTWPLRKRLLPRHWTPWSLFGHRFTCYGWGAQVKTRNGWWVWVRRPERRCYWSPTGTPDNATIWLRGRPPAPTATTEEGVG